MIPARRSNSSNAIGCGTILVGALIALGVYYIFGGSSKKSTGSGGGSDDGVIVGGDDYGGGDHGDGGDCG